MLDTYREGEEMEYIKDILSLEYRGGPVELGRMNSYEAAANIIAFSNFLEIIAKNTYGEKIELRTEIQGIRGESFDIDFFLNIGFIAAYISPILGYSSTFQDYYNLIKASIETWVHLAGRPPKQITPHTDNSVKIENQDGKIIYMNNCIVNVITSSKAGKAVEQFVRKPLEEGMSSLAIKSPTLKDETIIEKEKAPFFTQIEIDKPLIDTQVKMVLEILSPTFREGNKWQFSDGQTVFLADIQDEGFLNDVRQGVRRFGTGDRLVVMLHIKQSSTPTALSMQKSVIQVIEHIIPPKQGKLFL